MIIPFVEKKIIFEKYPVTAILILLNCLIFFVFFFETTLNEVDPTILKSNNLEVAGRVYQIMKRETKIHIEEPVWVKVLADTQNPHFIKLLGIFAIKQDDFLNWSLNHSFSSGNLYLIEQWKKDLKSYLQYKEKNPLNQFGLSKKQKSPIHWLTYQFSHGGAMHLLSNMIFLILLGVAVEKVAGSLTTLLVYLLGGFFGGFLFLNLNNFASVPMVGASASVSSLIAFYYIFEKKRNIQYFFFMTPFPNQWGWIYLPKYLIFPFFLISDFSSMLSTPEGLTSQISYTAHIGGTLFGLCFGYYLKYFSRPLTTFKES